MTPTLQLSQSVRSLDQQPLQTAVTPVAGYLRLILHRISAGFPSPAADYEDDGLDLNTYLVRNKPSTFMFTVRGDSMVNAGIFDGDKVVVDKSLEPNHQDIVVADVDGEFVIKRLFNLFGKVELHAENKAYRPIKFSEGSELRVWGVVVGVVRHMHTGSGPCR